MNKRNFRLDMGYDMSWGLLDDVSTEELNEELKQLDLKIKTQNASIAKAQEQLRSVQRKYNVLKEICANRRYAKTEKELQVTEDHRKLIAELYFKYYSDGGDYVFIGVNGKRPFGNSNIYGDVAEILGWEVEDELTDEQIDLADKLLYELPIVINRILKEKT